MDSAAIPMLTLLTASLRSPRYDWDSERAKLQNMGPHYTCQIDGRRVHFIHHPSRKANAHALILCHGWPGSVYEFRGVIASLAEGEPRCLLPTLTAPRHTSPLHTARGPMRWTDESIVGEWMGGEPHADFHLVIPSMPGYGWSEGRSVSGPPTQCTAPQPDLLPSSHWLSWPSAPPPSVRLPQ